MLSVFSTFIFIFLFLPNSSSRLNKNSEKLHWFIWFLIADDNLDPEIRIPFNCQFFKIEKGAFRAHRLVECYHIKNSSTFRNEFGIWTPLKGLKTSLLNISRRRMDLQGISLKISVCRVYTVEQSIEMYWNDYARMLNYTLKIEKFRRNNKKPMTIGDLDGTACLSAVTVLDYEKDWIISSSGERVKLLMKYRSTNEVGWRAYVQPFTSEMWVAVGVWLLLSTAAIVVVNGCSVTTFYNNAFTSFFCLCSSDPMAVHPPGEPISLPTKFVYLMSLAVPAVIIPAYSAYILSTLSVTRPLEPFNDLKGFIEDGTYKLAAVSNTFATRYLNGSNDRELNYIYNNLFEGTDNMAPTFPAFFERLCTNNKLVGLVIDARTFRRLFRCRMYFVPDVVLTISTGLLVQKGSPMRKMFTERLNEYREKGLKRRATSAEVYYKDFPEQARGLHSLNMSQVQALFLLVALGVALSLMVLAVEFAVENYSRQRSNRTYRRNL